MEDESLLNCQFTLTAASNEILTKSSETRVNIVESLGETLVFPN